MHRLLAILGIAFLLLNPAGFCAGNGAGVKSPSHPCCPHPTIDAGCVCIDRQPAAPSVPSIADAGPVVQVAHAYTALDLALTAPGLLVPEFDVSAPEDRSVQFHQLLL